ncbi:hypothetical protein V6259_14960 [Marinomonas sp. TI.3.20]|uniref:hypothetical protein n=1 Tax=Marinomonas sp. TI.3.20 TaxID=3121296 RepID=UPI00311F8584
MPVLDRVVLDRIASVPAKVLIEEVNWQNETDDSAMSSYIFIYPYCLLYLKKESQENCLLEVAGV